MMTGLSGHFWMIIFWVIIMGGGIGLLSRFSPGQTPLQIQRLNQMAMRWKYCNNGMRAVNCPKKNLRPFAAI